MTTLTPLAILAAVTYALTQVDDPITAGTVLLLALYMAAAPRRPRPTRGGPLL